MNSKQTRKNDPFKARIITFICFILFCCSHAKSDQTIEESYIEKIDQLVHKRLTDLGLTPNELASDEVFLRRITLGTVGRIPSVKEVDDYLNNHNGNKKSHLIDRLLKDPGYVSHQTNWMSDVLRAKTKTIGSIRGLAGHYYIDFIKKAFEKNQPYNKFVFEMLNSEGEYWNKNNGAVGYYMRDDGMPLDNLANTMQAFLGTRMSCAQCHDHPFDKWTQKNFYELAAFNNGIHYYDEAVKKGRNHIIQLAGLTKAPENKFVWVVLDKSLAYSINGKGNGHIRLPHDYQYKDAIPGKVLHAKTPFGEAVTMDYEPEKLKRGKPNLSSPKFLMNLKGSHGSYLPEYKENNSREAFAKWVTSSNNPRFSKLLANRLWKRVMGMGLIEPIDDIREHTLGSDPKLLSLLQEMVVAYEFDLKKIYKTLYSTQTYAKESQTNDVAYTIEMGFPGPILKRMTAEQTWDSIMSLRSDHYEQIKTESPDGLKHVYRSTKGKTPEEIAAFIKDYWTKTPSEQRGERDLIKYFSPKDPRNMSFCPDTHTKSDPRSLKEQKILELNKIMGPRPNDPKDRKLYDSIKKNKFNRMMLELKRDKVDNDPNYARASNLDIPSKPGHFLYQLGQSTKENTNGAIDEANIPQVLTLMNGLENMIDGSVLTGIRQHLSSDFTVENNINTLFKGTLCREASPEEMKDMMMLVKKYPQNAYQDILWTLINTHEFLFIL